MARQIMHIINIFRYLGGIRNYGWLWFPSYVLVRTETVNKPRRFVYGKTELRCWGAVQIYQ